MKPRIYVACLAAYNSGTLHGEWIEANQEASEIGAAVTAMLKASPEVGAEEWAIHDFEGFSEIRISEWEAFSRISALAKLIDDHGNGFALWYSNQDGQHTDEEALEARFLDQWQGVHDSKIAFANHLLDCTGQLAELPEWTRNYFDFDGYARDLELGGDYSFVPHEDQIYVYSNY